MGVDETSQARPRATQGIDRCRSAALVAPPQSSVAQSQIPQAVPLGHYIVDFYCHEFQLVIELDGGQHSEEVDRSRTQWLEGEGYRVVRFWNNEVLDNTDGVLAELDRQVGPSSNSG